MAEKQHDPQRAMNIACAVVITVVVVAMVVATIVYFCTGKDSGSGGGGGGGGGGQGYEAPIRPAQMSKQGSIAGKPVGTMAQHSAPQLGPAREGVIFPKLTKEDEMELAQSYQLKAVKNYAQGQKNAILSDPKYSQIYDLPPLHKEGSDFVSARPKEDELLFQAQSRQVKQQPEVPFNMTEHYHLLREKNVVPYLS